MRILKPLLLVPAIATVFLLLYDASRPDFNILAHQYVIIYLSLVVILLVLGFVGSRLNL